MNKPDLPDINKLSVHEYLEVEQKFLRLKDDGYIPFGLEEQIFNRMLLQKAIEIEAMTY